MIVSLAMSSDDIELPILVLDIATGNPQGATIDRYWSIQVTNGQGEIMLQKGVCSFSDWNANKIQNGNWSEPFSQCPCLCGSCYGFTKYFCKERTFNGRMCDVDKLPGNYSINRNESLDIFEKN